MRLRYVVLCAVVCLIDSSASTREHTTRDPKGLAVLAQSATALGAVPSDVRALGTVEVTEGSSIESGTITITALGLNQTAERLTVAGDQRSLTYSDGLAIENRPGAQRKRTLGESLSSQSPSLPNILVAAVLANADFAVEYLGTEDVSGVESHHLRFWNTFATKQKQFAPFAEFTRKDLWVDASTGRPTKLWFEQREGAGASPRVAVGAVYSDYRRINGSLLPFRIERYLNGTPWADVHIDSYSLNSGVSQSEFQVQGRPQ